MRLEADIALSGVLKAGYADYGWSSAARQFTMGETGRASSSICP